MKINTCAALLSLALASAGSIFGQGTTATTDPVGFVSVTVPAASDAILGVPLNRTADFKGVIQSIAGNVITVAGTSPAWSTSPQRYVFPGIPATQNNTYAVLIATGTKEGMIARVTANGANTVTIQLDAGDDLSGVKTEAIDGVGLGDHIDIMPYWTPSSLIPSTAAGGTQILGFVGAVAGVNLSSAQIYVHAGGGVWEDGITSDDATHAPLRFGSGFVLRNTSGSALPVSMVGSVPMTKYRRQLSTLAANTPQDITFGYASPVPETLDNVGLGSAPDGDQILGFNNAATGFNKAATQLLIRDGGVWTDQITGDPVGATFQLQPGFGYIYRKGGTASPSTTVWTDLPTYLQ